MSLQNIGVSVKFELPSEKFSVFPPDISCQNNGANKCSVKGKVGEELVRPHGMARRPTKRS